LASSSTSPDAGSTTSAAEKRLLALEVAVLDRHFGDAGVAQRLDQRLGDALAARQRELAAGDGHVLAGTPVDGAVVDGPQDTFALQVQGVDRVERAQHLVGVAQAEGPQEHRAEELALAVDAHVQQVLAVVLETRPTSRGTGSAVP
jgi:hypothetical protein